MGPLDRNAEAQTGPYGSLEELTEVRIRDVAHSIGIGHIGSNDIRVMADNLVKAHPDYRFVIMSDHKGQVTSAFENGVLTCCEYEEAKNAEQKNDRRSNP